MKLFRSKSLGTQLKTLRLGIDRVKKVASEIRELSMRDWKGGEMQTASEVRATRDKLDAAMEALREAEKGLDELQKLAERKGK